MTATQQLDPSASVSMDSLTVATAATPALPTQSPSSASLSCPLECFVVTTLNHLLQVVADARRNGKLSCSCSDCPTAHGGAEQHLRCLWVGLQSIIRKLAEILGLTEVDAWLWASSASSSSDALLSARTQPLAVLPSSASSAAAYDETAASAPLALLAAPAVTTTATATTTTMTVAPSSRSSRSRSRSGALRPAAHSESTSSSGTDPSQPGLAVPASPQAEPPSSADSGNLSSSAGSQPSSQVAQETASRTTRSSSTTALGISSSSSLSPAGRVASQSQHKPDARKAQGLAKGKAEVTRRKARRARAATKTTRRRLADGLSTEDEDEGGEHQDEQGATAEGDDDSSSTVSTSPSTASSSSSLPPSSSSSSSSPRTMRRKRASSQSGLDDQHGQPRMEMENERQRGRPARQRKRSRKDAASAAQRTPAALLTFVQGLASVRRYSPAVSSSAYSSLRLAPDSGSSQAQQHELLVAKLRSVLAYLSQHEVTGLCFTAHLYQYMHVLVTQEEGEPSAAYFKRAMEECKKQLEGEAPELVLPMLERLGSIQSYLANESLYVGLAELLQRTDAPFQWSCEKWELSRWLDVLVEVVKQMSDRQWTSPSAFDEYKLGVHDITVKLDAQQPASVVLQRLDKQQFEQLVQALFGVTGATGESGSAEAAHALSSSSSSSSSSFPGSLLHPCEPSAMPELQERGQSTTPGSRKASPTTAALVLSAASDSSVASV